MADKLTPKQQAFVDEYLIDLNATRAAIRAGYSEKAAQTIGAENMRKPLIKQAIQKVMDNKNSERIAKQDEVLELLTSFARGQIEEECIVVEGIGEGCSSARKMNKKITPADRMKAINLLAKRYGIDRTVVEVQDMTVKIVDDLGD